MAEYRIYDLNDPATIDTDDYLVIDSANYSEPKKISIADVLSTEVTDRQDMDTEIITAVGLEATGDFPVDETSIYGNSQVFATEGLSINLYNWVKILDGAISGIQLGQNQKTVVNLTSALILALNSTPLPVLSAPGVGYFVHLKEIVVKNNFNTTGYSCGENGIRFQFTGETDEIATIPQTVIESVASVIQKIIVKEHPIIANTSIEIIAPDSDPTTGDGTMAIFMEYTSEVDFSIPTVPAGSSCCVVPLTGTFVDGDLTASGNLEIVHNMNTLFVQLWIYDNTNTLQVTTFTSGDEGGANTLNEITTYIGAGITGTWRYFLIAKAV